MAEREIATFHVGGEREALAFDGGEGAYVYDTHGRSYLDFVCGYGPVVLGHADPEFQRSVNAFLSRGLHFPGYSRSHSDYAAVLPDWGGDAAVAFFKTSSEAMSAALRLGAMRSGRRGVVRCGFLGWHDALFSQETAWHERLGSPLRRKGSPGLPLRGASGDEAVFDWRDLDLGGLETLLRDSTDVVGTAALDVYQEDVAGSPLAEEFLRLCARYGVVSVLDETKSAGRIAEFGITQTRSLRPDFAVFGKALANGAPHSLLVIKEFDPGEFKRARVGGTYSKECSGVAAAVATRELMFRRDGHRVLRTQTSRVCSLLNAACADAGVSPYLRFVPVLDGTAFDLILHDDVVGETFAREEAKRSFLAGGILLLVGHPNFVCLAHADVPGELIYERACEGARAWRERVGSRLFR
ncbi:aminotransferase class III-fold pyridoxal phosphate-dependent enzyme [Thermopolyspora sp. NPDC052614]|uniref:aminotransferase class III-fold pyridoxal phosphate-dependent enzyme n=1 Tax=Thermopolyspora sp. NPDC052614 TaxID=3155682 RepID=UPI0034390F74